LLDGTVFGEALDESAPFTFTVGMDRVVLGWEEAILSMRVGEKRTVIVPYALGYGLRGRPPEIPNRATLVFEIELLAVE
jgi:FKBP-type peptidyl-prolyl cis-trans isomerase